MAISGPSTSAMGLSDRGLGRLQLGVGPEVAHHERVGGRGGDARQSGLGGRPGVPVDRAGVLHGVGEQGQLPPLHGDHRGAGRLPDDRAQDVVCHLMVLPCRRAVPPSVAGGLRRVGPGCPLRTVARQSRPRGPPRPRAARPPLQCFHERSADVAVLPTTEAMAVAAADDGSGDPAGGGGPPRAWPTPCSPPATPSWPSWRPCSLTRARRALVGHGGVPHGRVRGGGAGPSGRLPPLDPRPDRGPGPSPGHPLPRRPGPPGRRVRSVRRAAAPAPPRPVLPGHRRERPPGLQRPAGGRLRGPPRRQGGHPRRGLSAPAGQRRALRRPTPTCRPGP